MRFSLVILVVVGVLAGCFPRGREYGKELYTEHCSNCHGIEGNGLHKLYPPIKGSDFLIQNQNQLGCWIRFGIEGKMVVNGVVYNEKMPSSPMLSDVDVANIINYISENIEPRVNKVQLQEVEVALQECVPE